MASLLFVIRTAIAWALAAACATALWHALGFPRIAPLNWAFVVLVTSFAVAKVIHAIAHLRRVQLITGHIDADSLSYRQRRQIEIPCRPDEAFDIVEAAIRELPAARIIESARDSLRIRARTVRELPADGYRLWKLDLRWFVVRSHQILATLVAGTEISSLTLICEPDGGVWADWFQFDDGSNLENADALARAITRRIAEHRRNEQASARQTSTEKELAVAKLSLLHAQVEPHFLYNTLASAQILTRTDPARADEMLGNLISYLRHSLPRAENTLSTLGEEIERSRAYLEILRVRMGDRLQLKIEAPQELQGVAFPAMMLQTLVENAIKHGLEPKYGGGSVWIIARADGADLKVTVADDGLGFNTQTSGTGIGLANVRERLRLAFGDAASFAIVANYPSGVAATISVPLPKPQAATP